MVLVRDPFDDDLTLTKIFLLTSRRVERYQKLRRKSKYNT